MGFILIIVRRMTFFILPTVDFESLPGQRDKLIRMLYVVARVAADPGGLAQRGDGTRLHDQLRREGDGTVLDPRRTLFVPAGKTGTAAKHAPVAISVGNTT